MTSSQEPTGVLRRVLRRLHRSEAGQGLVEYALIIVVVSLGSLVALKFLGGEVSNLFTKAGSSIREGAGTGATGGVPGAEPANGDPVTGTNIPAGSVYYRANAIDDAPSSDVDGLAGVYTDSTPTAEGTCSFSIPGSPAFAFSGTWLPADDDDQWDGPGISGSFRYACVVLPAFTAPPNDTSISDGAGVEWDNGEVEHGDGRWYNAGALTPDDDDNSPLPLTPPAANAAGIFDIDDDVDTESSYYYIGGSVFRCTWQSLPDPSGGNVTNGQNWDYLGGTEENYWWYCTT